MGCICSTIWDCTVCVGGGLGESSSASSKMESSRVWLLFCWLSSFHLSTDLRLAFMKKLDTVEGSKPSCLAIVTCISLEGRFVS